MRFFNNYLFVKRFPNYDLRKYSTRFSSHLDCKVVICGGGFVGTSVAHFLSQTWPKSCIVIDAFTDNYTSNINSTFINLFKPNPSEACLIKITSDLLNIQRCGSLFLTSDKSRIDYFNRVISIIKTVPGIEKVELLSPSEITNNFSGINLENIEGGVWVPGDGIITNLAESKAKLKKSSQDNGAQFLESCQVKKVLTFANRVIGVEVIDLKSSQIIRIGCEYFVNAGGFWSKNIGKLSSPQIKIPVLSCEHQILETEPSSQLASDLNFILHKCDEKLSIHKQADDSFIIEGYPVVSKPLDPQDAQKKLNFSNPRFSPKWNIFHPILSAAIDLMPGIGNAKLKKLHYVPRNYSPDGCPVVGESAEIENYFIATGVNYDVSCGVGKLIAHRITGERCEELELKGDFWSFDPRRFNSNYNVKSFLMDRLREVPYRVQYEDNLIIKEYDNFKTGHYLRSSPIYNRLHDSGAIFIQIMGYEKPAVYFTKEDEEMLDLNLSDLKPRILRFKGFGKPYWFDVVKKEYEACREKVAICDYCSFTKLELSSPNEEVVDFLQYLCSNDVDISPGSIVHTGMHNERGGYENDVSLIRLDRNRYMLIGPAEQQTRCLSWINKHIKDNRIAVRDITNFYTAICIMGPLAKQLLSLVVSDPNIFEDFHFFSYKELEIGNASRILACNLTHTGELGWVLYIPNYHALDVYDKLINAGKEFGLRHAGSIAMRILRIEKFYVYWGQDIDTNTTPLECGRGFRIQFDKNFIGREALLKQKKEGIRRRYVQLVMDEEEGKKLEKPGAAWPWGNEPIYAENHSRPLGMTTTTGYGFTLNRHLCLGFVRHYNYNEIVTNDYVLNTRFKVGIGKESYWVKANIHSPKLPGNIISYNATK